MCDVQRPFAQEDPEGAVAERLAEELRRRELAVDLARVPEMPPESPAGPLIWRMLDLVSGGGEGVDLLVATRFPSYLARHPNKVVWLLDEPAASQPDLDRRDLDRRVLGEARRLFAASTAAARALQEAAGVDAAVLPVPAAGAPPESWDEAVAELTSTL